LSPPGGIIVAGQTGVGTVVAKLLDILEAGAWIIDERIIGYIDTASTLAYAEVEGIEGSDGWYNVANMATARANFATASLPDGRILIAGGDIRPTGDWDVTNECEIFDPVTFQVTPATSMIDARANFELVPLPNGNVMAVAGYDGSDFFPRCEIYDPVTDTWTSTSSLNSSSNFYAIGWLTNTTFMKIGGNSHFGGTGCEIFDLSTEIWSVAPSMNTGRSVCACERLLDGRIIVAGGYMFTSSIELYDPGAGSWSEIGNLPQASDNPSSTLLDDGRVFFTGGNYWSGSHQQYDDVTIFDPNGDKLSAGPSMLAPRGNHRSIKLPDGDILVIGGGEGSSIVSMNSCERFDVTLNTWSAAPSLNTARMSFEVILANGRVYAIGGYDDNVSTNTIEGLFLSKAAEINKGCKLW